MTDLDRPDSETDRMLDAALARALAPPHVPARLRVSVQAALARSADSSILQARQRLEWEQREKLAQLDADYVRLRRRTLGTMIGGAFAAGAAAALALPWVTEHLGPFGPAVIASIGAATGIGIGISSWLRSLGERGSGIRS